MSSVVVREGVEADLGLIIGFIRALAEYERLASSVALDPEVLRGFLFGARRYAETLIASVDGRPVGFALFFHNFSTFLGRPGVYLEDLFVVPEARGSGAGRALLARLAGIAVERGCGRLEWSVLDWNEDAIGFYRRLGAVPKDEWTVYQVSGDALRALAGG